jgi:hypothetical protein
MATTLPPYLPGTIDATSWTGPVPLDPAGEANPGTPDDYTAGPEGTFSGGTYVSSSGYSPTISYKQLVTATSGRRYTLELVVIKLTSGADSYVKPGLINVDIGAAINMSGALDGNGFEPGSAGGAYNTASWPIGSPVTLRPYWNASSSLNFRVRCRFNRRLADAPLTDGSTATYRLTSFKFFAELHLPDIQGEFGGSNPVSMSEYYRGGGLVPNTGTNTRIPTSGEISFGDFFGGEA